MPPVLKSVNGFNLHSDGQLFHQYADETEQLIDNSPVQAIAAAGPSSIFDLHKDGSLILLKADGTSHLIDGKPVQAIVSAGPSSIFDLRKDGSLILLNADGTSHLIDDKPVQAIVSAGPSSIFDLHKDGNLILLKADGTSGLIDDKPVQAIVSAGPSSIFDLHKDGNLILLNADGTSHLIDGNPVQAIVSAGPSSIFDLHKDGNLILLNADGTSHLIDDKPVQAIVSAGPSSIFDMHKDGSLVVLNADGSSQVIDSKIYAQYFDRETGIIMRPPESADFVPFGDGIWRSAWFYASLIVIAAKDPATYEVLKSEHLVDVSMAGNFLQYFRDNCISENGWTVPKTNQKFSRDQLVPLLYLLGAVAAYQAEFKPIGTDIMKSLSKLEEHFVALSDSSQGSIGRNIGYMIDVLADNARYGFNYRTFDMPIYLLPCVGDIDCAKNARRKVYKEMFGLAIKAHQLAGWVQGSTGLDVSDEFSVFNALGAVSLQCIAWGKDDSDVQVWRDHFKTFADDGWGPAFRLVAGRSVANADIDVYYTSYTTRALDNDIIMAQRPGKVKSGELQPGLPPGPNRWLLLDYVVLKGLQVLWG